MKLYQDNNTRKAFVMYVLGSVNSWGICEHDRFENDEGMDWAKGLIEDAFWTVTQRKCDSYVQKGCFSIYQNQTLTPENRVYMDLFEILMFGNNNPSTNRAEVLPKEVIQRIGLSIHTMFRLLTSNTSSEKKEKAEGAKAYDELFEKTESTMNTRSTATTSQGIGWLKFYVNWRFPIGFLIGALSILSSIVQGVQYKLFTYHVTDQWYHPARAGDGRTGRKSYEE